MKNCIPNYWEREREWGTSFPTFGNGNGNEKNIPNFREREWEASIPGNGREREFLPLPRQQSATFADGWLNMWTAPDDDDGEDDDDDNDDDDDDDVTSIVN